MAQVDAEGNRTSFTYDAAGRLEVVSNEKSTGAIISRFTYTYDNVGNRTSVDEGGGDSVDWTYDDTYRLRRRLPG